MLKPLSLHSRDVHCCSVETNRTLDRSVADPDPGYGAFLTPGSGMGKN